MLYLALKTLHVVAVILWVGSLVLLSVIYSRAPLSREQFRIAARVTEAAIGATWIAGIVLAVMGSWYSAIWWQLKVLLVVGISAMHTILHRRWGSDDATSATSARFVFPLLLLTVGVVALVMFKAP